MRKKKQAFWVAYLQLATGVGRTAPAVYTAWKMPFKLTLLVTSLIRTGASLLDRSFLCTHRKLISTDEKDLPNTRITSQAESDVVKQKTHSHADRHAMLVFALICFLLKTPRPALTYIHTHRMCGYGLSVADAVTCMHACMHTGFACKLTASKL